MIMSLEDAAFVDREIPGSSSSGGVVTVTRRDFLTSGELMDEAIESAEADPASMMEVRKTDEVTEEGSEMDRASFVRVRFSGVERQV